MTYSDKVCDVLSKLSDDEIAHMIDFCNIYYECGECHMRSKPDSKRAWLKQEV